jgi:hypothetical protein
MTQRMVAGMARSYVVAFLLLCGVPAHAGLPDTVDKIRPSIVAVGTVKPAKRANADGPALNYLGTGFVVGNGRQVITNFHVIPQKLDAEAMEALAVFVGRGGSGEGRQARVVRSDRDHDVALLEIGGAPCLRCSWPSPRRCAKARKSLSRAIRSGWCSGCIRRPIAASSRPSRRS